jgi:hypothetical protein
MPIAGWLQSQAELMLVPAPQGTDAFTSALLSIESIAFLLGVQNRLHTISAHSTLHSNHLHATSGVAQYRSMMINATTSETWLQRGNFM